MRRQERFESLQDALLAAFDGLQSGIWTAMPCIIQSFDPVAMTVTAKPSITSIRRLADGIKTEEISLPLLVDVPIYFPTGGGFTLTFPVKIGDEALVVFASRCIDAWWQLGGRNIDGDLRDTQPQLDQRFHDLSDGFAFVGIRSQPRVISGISTTTTQLRSDDGNTFVEVDQGTVNVVAPIAINFTSPIITMNGHVVIHGAVDQDGGLMTSAGIVASTHQHTGVTAGPSNTGGPV